MAYKPTGWPMQYQDQREIVVCHIEAATQWLDRLRTCQDMPTALRAALVQRALLQAQTEIMRLPPDNRKRKREWGTQAMWSRDDAADRLADARRFLQPLAADEDIAVRVRALNAVVEVQQALVILQRLGAAVVAG